MERVFFSLGSNRGNRHQNIKKAYVALCRIIEQAKLSSIFETKPMYFLNQSLFLNAVMCGHTSMAADKLLLYIQAIERDLGRERKKEHKNGPRTIDIDILLFGNQTIITVDLVIPHPRMTERKFVLVPLLELEPDLRNPLNGKLFKNYLSDLGNQGVYLYKAL